MIISTTSFRILLGTPACGSFHANIVCKMVLKYTMIIVNEKKNMFGYILYSPRQWMYPVYAPSN